MGRVKSKKKGETTTKTCDRNCGLVDTDEMVICDYCEGSAHFKCAGVDNSIADPAREWMCLRCAALKIPPLAPKITSTQETQSTSTQAKQTVSPNLPASGSSPTPTSDPKSQSEDQRKLQSAYQVITKLKRDYQQDAERHKSQLDRADQNARECLQETERQSNLLADAQQAHAKIQEELRAKLAASDKETARLQLSHQDLQHQLQQLRAAMEQLQQRAPVELIAPPEAATNQPEVNINLISPIVDPPVTPLLNRRVQSESLRQNVRLEMPADQEPPSLDAITASIMEKLGPVIGNLVREMVPGSAPNVAPPVAEATPFVERRSHTAPTPQHADSLVNLSRYCDLFDKVDQPEQGSQVERLAVTMGRPFLAKLPEFDGSSFKSWPLFESIYETTTIQGQFTEIDNVNRLRVALKGKAEEHVRSQLMFPESATAIMIELREAFGKPELILRELTNDLLKIPKMRSKTDWNLRNFSTELRNYVASLEKMKLTSELNNVFIAVQLEEKLDFDHQREWHKRKLESFKCPSDASIRAFSDFVRERVRELPTDSLVRSRQAPISEPEKKVRRVHTHQGQQEKSASGPAHPISCFKCTEAHAMSMCPQFKKMTPRERSKFVLESKICTSCLKSKRHVAKDCRGKRACGTDGCTFSHHPMLHFAKTNQNSNSRNNDQSDARNTEQQNNPAQSSSGSVSGVSNTHILSVEANSFMPSRPTENVVSHQPHLSHEGNNQVLFKILPIRVYNDKGEFVETFAFLDDGSSLTLCDRELYDSLGLSGCPEQLQLQWTKGITRNEDSHRTDISISGIKNKSRFILTNVYAVEHLDLPEQTVNAKALQSQYPHLRGIPLPDFKQGKPQILIGLQHSKFLLGTNNHSAGDDDPIACKTLLGWTIFGNTSQTIGVVSLLEHRRSGVQLSMHEATKTDEALHKLVKGFFSTENFGVMPPVRDLISAENERALSIMSRTLKKTGNRYEIGLLWKSDNVQLPDSYPMALKRLISLERNLKKNPELLQWKNNHVKELVTKGYARKASTDELRKSWPRIWYCPTFVVVNPNKLPPKPRDVADVAATVNGQSLNSNLLKGPDNIAPLLQGLCRFRENAIAVNADVREMFHQIAISEEDQQCQRFLYRDCDDSQPPTVYIMQRMMFGPTCSPSCAQFVKNHHASKFLDVKPEAASALIKYTYVDDYFNSHATEDEALKVINDAFEICSSMGFDLVGVQSNSRRLLEQLPEDKVKTSLVNIESKEAENYIAKVLGMHWQSVPDHFTFRMCRDELVAKMLTPSYFPSKREILKVLMRVFDPLGLIAMYLIRGKIVLQEIWREGTGWDDPIPSCLLVLWQEFINELPNIENLRIARRYTTLSVEDSDIDLLVFVDASEQAFAATAYFRFEHFGNIEVAHVMAKAKVAPIKRLTIPQLELQAAVLGVRLAKTVKEMHSFKLRSTRYFSDSKVVLAWICSRKYNFKTFVAARIGEILEYSNRKEWFHVGSKNNVADDGTKWSDPYIGDNDSRWFKGPPFLHDSSTNWPVKPAVECEEDSDVVKHSQLFIHLFHRNENIAITTIDEIAPRFQARWTSLVRVIAFIYRFKNSALLKVRPETKFITPVEFQAAEEKVFMKIQRESFGDEYRALAAKEKSVSKSSKIFKLCPFLKDGIIRMSSRSQKANISYAAKCPAILPQKHRLVELFIQHHHERNFHMGTEMTVADTRTCAWIVDVKTAVEKVKRNCQLCKIFKAQPVMPLMGELPFARVDFGAKPFTHVGLDAFGPYNVKFGRGSVKRYGLIFTCLTYRAVHLEVLNDMSTDSCIMAIRRFLVRRGWSAHFYSDNGKNFVGAKNVLHEEISKLEKPLGEALANHFFIHWHLQPAYAPWWGGAWERLIRSIKLCIKFLMNEEYPREDVFHNAMVEAEYWMNRRPLTHNPIDHEDAPPLTPNSVLFGETQDQLASSVGIFTVGDPYSRKAHQRSQHLVNKFITRWTKEYLPSINRRSKWYERTKPVKIGDIAILTDPTTPKSAWKKCRIVKLHPGSDGVTRAVDVEFPDKSTKKNRPVGLVAVLDVGSSAQSTEPQMVPGMLSDD